MSRIQINHRTKNTIGLPTEGNQVPIILTLVTWNAEQKSSEICIRQTILVRAWEKNNLFVPPSRSNGIFHLSRHKRQISDKTRSEESHLVSLSSRDFFKRSLFGLTYFFKAAKNCFVEESVKLERRRRSYADDFLHHFSTPDLIEMMACKSVGDVSSECVVVERWESRKRNTGYIDSSVIECVGDRNTEKRLKV